MPDTSTNPYHPAGLSRLAWLPIPLLLVLSLLPGAAGTWAVTEPAWLLPLLNLTCSTAVSFVIVLLAARSYRRSPSRAVLLLGSGMLAFGLANAAAGVLVPLGRTNAAVTVHNGGVALAGLCQLGSALGALAPRRDRRVGRPLLAMVGAPALVVAVLVGLTWATLLGFVPAFFGATGPTLLRQEVVVAAAVMFGLSAVLFRLMNVQARSQFVRWYALGLGLIAVGLVGIEAADRVGSLAAWAGRGAEYLGGLYMLWGAWQAVREGRPWELPLGALMETRERYRRLVEVSPDAILVHADGRCVFANPAAVQLFGADSPADLLGRSVLELVHPQCRDMVADCIRRLSLEEGPGSLRGAKLRRLDGAAVDAEVTASRVEFGGRTAIQAVMRDVSVRARAEEALRASEQRFKATFENAAVGIAHLSLDGRYVWVNGKYCEIMGYSAEELRDRTFADLTDQQDLEESLDQAGHLLNGEVPSYVMEKRCRRKDGSIIWVNLNASLQRDTMGAPDHFVAVVQDVSERRAAEEALRQSRQELKELSESLEQRVAERTAEVQRLADQLRALATRLSRVELDDRQRMAKILHDHIQQLLVAARMQLDSVRRASDVSRVESLTRGVDSILQEAIDASRSMAVELSPPALHHSGLQGGLRWLARQMQEKSGLTVHLRTDGAAEPAAEVLRLLLFECVRELLLNVLKHSGVTEASVALGSTREGMARIVVEDEGRGFDPQLLLARDASDASFGLFSIQQRLMDCGGEMGLDTAPGRGTRVSITVPLGEALPAGPDGQGAAEREGPALPAQQGDGDGKIRVLVVDDHEIMREGLAGLLRFEPDIEIVGEAADGPQAVALAEELRPDVITMDVSLPGMNGIEVTRAIVSKVPGARIIGLSMHLGGGVAEAMRQAGAVAYVTKGGPSEDLLAAIRACRGG